MDKFENFAKTYNVNMQGEYPNLLFKATDIGTVLGISNIHCTTQSLPPSSYTKIKIETNRGLQNAVFLTTLGLKTIICSSRKSKAQEMAKVLGIDIVDTHLVCIETSTLDFIQEAFEGEKMTTHFPFGKYSVDLYFNDYNIVVEYDECQHNKTHNTKLDNERQQYIETTFGSTFVRIRQNEGKISIAKAINQIYKIIIKSKSPSIL